MSGEEISSSNEVQEWRVNVQELVTKTHTGIVLGLDEVMNYMGFTHSVTVTQGIEIFLDKKVMDGPTPKSRFRVAFIPNLNVTISNASSEVQNVLKGTEVLLHSIFRVTTADIANVTRLLTSKTRNDGNLYCLVAIFGYTSNKNGIDNLEVITATLGGYSPNVGGYLAYLATTQTKYSTRKYGKSADGNAFERRGLGRLAVSLFQFTIFWRSLGKVKPLYLHCSDERVATFLQYGFTRCIKSFPAKAIELQSLLGVSPTDVKEAELTAMTIETPVLGTFEKQIKLSATGFTPSTQATPAGAAAQVMSALQSVSVGEATRHRAPQLLNEEQQFETTQDEYPWESATATTSISRRPITEKALNQLKAQLKERLPKKNKKVTKTNTSNQEGKEEGTLRNPTPELTPHMIEIIDNVFQLNKGSNKPCNAAKIRKYVENGIGCQLDAPLNRALVARVNALTNGKVTSAPKTQAHQTKTALAEQKGIEAAADKSDKAPSNVEQVTTSATSNVEEQVTARTQGGNTEAALKKCDKASSHAEEQGTELTNEMKKFIDKLYEERKESSILMLEYRNELEREIGSSISAQQWNRLKDRVRGLSDGTTLPYGTPTHTVEASLPKGKEAEAIDTLDRNTLDELQTLPQSVKNFIDNVLAKRSRTRVNVVDKVVKRLKCSAIPDNFKSLILEYSKVVQEKQNDPEEAGTSLRDEDEERCCHVCVCDLTTGETDTCVLCNQVVHTLCCQDSGQTTLHCNSCHLKKLKGYFKSLKEVPLKLISDIDAVFSMRETDDTAETLITKVEVTWRFLGEKLPGKQRKMVIKHLEGLFDGKWRKEEYPNAALSCLH